MTQCESSPFVIIDDVIYFKGERFAVIEKDVRATHLDDASERLREKPYDYTCPDCGCDMQRWEE